MYIILYIYIIYYILYIYVDGDHWVWGYYVTIGAAYLYKVCVRTLQLGLNFRFRILSTFATYPNHSQ